MGRTEFDPEEPVIVLDVEIEEGRGEVPTPEVPEEAPAEVSGAPAPPEAPGEAPTTPEEAEPTQAPPTEAEAQREAERKAWEELKAARDEFMELHKAGRYDEALELAKEKELGEDSIQMAERGIQREKELAAAKEEVASEKAAVKEEAAAREAQREQQRAATEEFMKNYHAGEYEKALKYAQENGLEEHYVKMAEVAVQTEKEKGEYKESTEEKMRLMDMRDEPKKLMKEGVKAAHEKDMNRLQLIMSLLSEENKEYMKALTSDEIDWKSMQPGGEKRTWEEEKNIFKKFRELIEAHIVSDISI